MPMVNISTMSVQTRGSSTTLSANKSCKNDLNLDFNHDDEDSESNNDNLYEEKK